MKQFNNIIDAIYYRKNCPLCKHRLKINERNLAEEFGLYGKQRISFYIDQRNIDYCTIDPETNKIELSVTEENHFNYQPGFHGGVATYMPPPSTKPYTVRSGRFIHALQISCESCCLYRFTLQVHIDLSKCELIVALLDSESITIENEGLAHEIKNSYSMSKTYYTCFGIETGEKKSELPLIEMDMANIKETISRIRKLLIFS